MWRSLVARFVRDEEVAGSNPVTPTLRTLGNPNVSGGFSLQDDLGQVSALSRHTPLLHHQRPVQKPYALLGVHLPLVRCE